MPNRKHISRLHWHVSQLLDWHNELRNRVLADEYKYTILRKTAQMLFTYQVFFDALMDLTNGRISPHFITPDRLKDDLLQVDRQIKMINAEYSVIHLDLAYYYTGKHLCSFTYTTDTLIIHLLVPFVKPNSLYDIYLASSFPIPLQAGVPKSKGYSILPKVAYVLAISPAKDKYIELTYIQFQLCSDPQSKLISCPYSQVIRKRGENLSLTCTAAVFFQDNTRVLQLCNPLIYPHDPVPTNIINISQNKFIVTTAEDTYSMSCTNQDLSVHDSMPIVIIDIPCTCRLWLEDMSVSPGVADCLTSSLQVTVRHPLNLYMFLSMNYDSQKYSPLELSENPRVLDLPDISAYVANFSDIDSKISKAGLDLSQVMDAVKTARTTYDKPLPTDLYADMTFLEYFSDSDVVAIYILTSTVIIIALIVIIAFHIKKVRSMDILLTAALTATETAPDMIPKAESFLITHSTTPGQVVKLETPTQVNITAITGGCLVVIFIVIVMAIVTTKLITYATKRFRIYCWDKIFRCIFRRTTRQLPIPTPLAESTPLSVPKKPQKPNDLSRSPMSSSQTYPSTGNVSPDNTTTELETTMNKRPAPSAPMPSTSRGYPRIYPQVSGVRLGPYGAHNYKNKPRRKLPTHNLVHLHGEYQPGYGGKDPTRDSGEDTNEDDSFQYNP